MINLTIWYSGLWNWFARGMWKNLELSARKDLEDLIGHSGGSLEDQNRERNMDTEDLTHEISERNKDYIKN